MMGVAGGCKCVALQLLGSSGWLLMLGCAIRLTMKIEPPQNIG